MTLTASIPYLDLSIKDSKRRKELLDAVDRVLSHGRVILGPEVKEFEEKVAAYSQTKYALGVNSGTDALYLALRCLDIGPGDEVITTPLSWIATCNAITLTGATPVFIDIEKDLNLNPDLIQSAITPRTKAVLPVHYTGQPCRINEILKIAQKNNLYLIEDAAQAFGSHHKGKMAGSFGHISCFSMNPMKVFSSYGEAGAVVTNNLKFHQKLESLRYAGTINKEDCHYPSLNGRIDTIQAAMMLVNLRYLEEKIECRRRVAQWYLSGLKDVVTLPEESPGNFHTYYSYTIVTPQRDELKQYLTSKGIETKIQHPILMPHHTAYKSLYNSHLPQAERLVKEILCLPNHEELSKEDVSFIIDTIKDFFS